ncbi:hypothetical protein ACFUJ0_03975 [Streptomyces sp. NPDC057242]|uniref:hypothetical protein n=1 Tax=unclassified Streptomyces TaxID=2593676 RepID=UPI00362BBA57
MTKLLPSGIHCEDGQLSWACLSTAVGLAGSPAVFGDLTGMSCWWLKEAFLNSSSEERSCSPVFPWTRLWSLHAVASLT